MKRAWRRTIVWIAVTLCVVVARIGITAEDRSTEPGELKAAPAVFDKTAPQGVDDLRAMQQHVQHVLKRVLPATVMIRTGSGVGSGAIITPDGDVLTAAHVVGTPGIDATVCLLDGRLLKAKVLGVNRGTDLALVHIVESGKFPFIEAGRSAPLKPGQWCLALGYPGEFRQGRTPLASIGRVLDVPLELAIHSGCTVEGGASGGPLIDMYGKVIGIHHSGDAGNTSDVPIDRFNEARTRFSKAEFLDNGGNHGN